MPRFLLVSPGIYRERKAFFHRPWIRGRRTWRKLKSTSLWAAKEEASALRTDHARSKLGLVRDPYAKAGPLVRLSDLFGWYLEAGCPKGRRGGLRTGSNLQSEQTRVATLKRWWGRFLPAEVELDQCDKYKRWRVTSIRHGKGHRQIDTELITLSNVFRWAMRNSSRTGVKFNPVGQERPVFDDPSEVCHCRDRQPASGDELHELARRLFASRGSEVLGWQLLIQAMTGARAHEIVRLRWDATSRNEPGFIQDDCLWLYNSPTTKGTAEFIRLTEPLTSAIAALRQWHDSRFPRSPWWFPGRTPAEPVERKSLTYALYRLADAEKVPRRTSQGLRSFFVTVLRSQGVPDHEIALRVGHKSGGSLIVRVYGKVVPQKLSWMPESGKPAWCGISTGLRAKSPKAKNLTKPA